MEKSLDTRVEQAHHGDMTNRQAPSMFTVNIPGYGTVEVTTAAFDAAMARYLPASPASLRYLCEGRSGSVLHFIHDVSAFVAMLADWDYNVDSSPLSVDAMCEPTR